MREDLVLEEVAEDGAGIGAFVDAGNGDGKLGVFKGGEYDGDSVLWRVGEEEEGSRVFC